MNNFSNKINLKNNSKKGRKLVFKLDNKPNQNITQFQTFSTNNIPIDDQQNNIISETFQNFTQNEPKKILKDFAQAKKNQFNTQNFIPLKQSQQNFQLKNHTHQTYQQYLENLNQSKNKNEQKVKENLPKQKTKLNFKKFTIEDFEIGEKLGKGRFGSVFLAREKKSNYIVALKILKKIEVKRMNAEKQIVREINIHSYIDHPNIIKLYGFFHDDQNIYLILEYAPDGELYQELRSTVIQKARQKISRRKGFQNIKVSSKCILLFT